MTTPQSHQPVSAVRARMIEDMTVRGFTEHTRRDYIRCVRALAAFLGRSPDTATAEDLRRFQLHQTQSGMRPPGINSSVSALRFFFTVTLDRPEPNGLAGATIALVAVFLPGLLLLMGVIPFWDAFRAHPNAQALMRGANAAVVGILGAALYDPVFTSAVVGPLPVRPRTDLLRTADGLEDAALGGGDCRRNRRHPDRARLSGRRPGPAGAPDRRDRPGRRRGIWIVGQHLRHRRRSARRAYDLTKTVYLFTAGAIGLVIDSGRIATYVWQGAMLDARLLWGLVVFVPISFIGAKLAERVVDHIPQERFRTVVAVFLGLIALQLLLLLGAMDQGNR